MSSSIRPVALVISTVEWTFAWQRHQTLASLLARDWEVVFCEVPGVRGPRWSDGGRLLRRFLAGGLARGRAASDASESGVGTPPLPAGLRIVRPALLPAVSRFLAAINGWRIVRFLRTEPGLASGVDLILNYSPSRSARQLIERIPHRRLVYDCTDHWLAVRGIPSFLAADEAALLARADLTLVPSHFLETLKRPLARRLERLPHGALVERFAVGPKAPSRDGAVSLLYYGHLHRQHLDFDLLAGLARARPGWLVVLVGPIKTPGRFPSNVRLAGAQAHERLRDFVDAADVLLLPYAVNDYTRAVLPAKIYECLATGRPIVAAPLPELVEGFGDSLYFAANGAGFAAAVERALAENTPERQARRRALAEGNAWEGRYGRLKELLASIDPGPGAQPQPRGADARTDPPRVAAAALGPGQVAALAPALPGGRDWAAAAPDPPSAPVLSVIVVAYKSRDEIGPCLASLPRRLEGREVEVIVVDNSAGDGTGDVVRLKYPYVNYIAPMENLGFGRANNRGLAEARGERVLFLNPDTVCSEAALAHCLARLGADDRIGLISPRLVLADGSMDLACRRSIPTLWDGFCRASGLAALFPRAAIFGGYNLTHLPVEGTYPVGAINGAFMLAPRRVLEEVGDFDESFFMYGDDLDLCIRVARAGWKIVYDGSVQIVHLKGTSVAKDYDRMSRAIFDANRDVYLKHFNPRHSRLVRWKYRIAFGAWKWVARARARLRGRRRVRPA